MEIKTIRCPSCGGNLNVENINQSLFYCQYCGSAVHLETNRNKGYDMEHGRLDARAEMADSVLEEIEKIKPELIRNGKAKRDMNTYPSEISDLKIEKSVSLSMGLKDDVFKGFLKGLGVLFLGAFFVVALHSVLIEPLFFLVELAVLLAPVYIPAIGIVKLIKKRGEMNNQIANYEKRLKECQKVYGETNDFLAKNANIDIPPRFRNETALNYIIKGLKAREFVSLEQALFRCEETLGIDEVSDLY
ncbi:MAG: hypothetical protein IK081_14150 [Lachnospiraceae bacterium]|nr:hypothetical protein [Lachnospiraceae bacterium]